LLNWHGDFGTPNESEGDSQVDDNSHKQQANGIEDQESTEMQDVSTATMILDSFSKHRG
jgi:hypothetical protein